MCEIVNSDESTWIYSDKQVESSVGERDIKKECIKHEEDVPVAGASRVVGGNDSYRCIHYV